MFYYNLGVDKNFFHQFLIEYEKGNDCQNVAKITFLLISLFIIHDMIIML